MDITISHDTALPLLLHKCTDMYTVGKYGAEMRQMSTDEFTHRQGIMPHHTEGVRLPFFDI